MSRNGQVILSKNIKLDKSYRNILSYNEKSMYELCLANKVVSANDYSFIKTENNVIIVNFKYHECIQANYIAFQNPNYSMKWFFAFIDRVEYLSENSTKIYYTVDVNATWWDYWTGRECFVIREHTNDDTVGSNTVPEDVELGEIIINDSQPIEYSKLSLLSNMLIIVGTSRAITDTNGNYITNGNKIYGGLYSGLYYLAFQNAENVTKFLRAMDSAGRGDDIYSIFMLPKALINITNWITASLEGQTFIFAVVPDSSSAINLKANDNPNYISISLNNTLDGYNPKNNKLKTAPYNYLLITNNSGGEVMYRYEDFTNNTPQFKLVGTISVGGSIKLLPMKYKKANTDSDNNSASIYGVNAGKYPTCSWQSDSYTNWLTQNSVNLALQYAQSSFNVISGVATENYGQALTGAMGIAREVSQVYQAQFMPVQAKGNTNAGDITYSGMMQGFRYLKLSVKSEYAKIIDDYFTVAGYKVNRLKIPNVTGRPYWNYVQIGNNENIGYPSGTVGIPSDHMTQINQIFRNGVTIWHNHTNLGNYSLDNRKQ